MSMASYAELKNQLKELRESRKQYLHIKTNTINNLIEDNSKNNIIQSENINDNLKEIDQEIESLSSIIKTSVNIAISIIAPIKEKELIINNVNGTIDILNIEKSIKDLLKKLESENVIEKKIQIILDANKYINVNPSIFQNYHEQFIKKSLDVLSYLNTGFNSSKENINFSNPEKESTDFIKEMEKNSILIFKLTNKSDSLISLFEFLSNFIYKTNCSDNKMKEITSELEKFNNEFVSEDDIIKFSDDIKLHIHKIFKKISQNIHERQNTYLNLQSFQTNEKQEPILLNLISKLIKGNEKPISFLLQTIITLSKYLEKGKENCDIICKFCSDILSECEKFKFYITVLTEKLKVYYNIEIKKNENDEISSFFKNFNSIVYDIGEKYCNNEIIFMKTQLITFFEEESKKYTEILDTLLNSNFDNLTEKIFDCIEDTFFILKTSGQRAISTLNLQMTLAIINHIIGIIINEDLYTLLDIKISSILIKTEDSSKNRIEFAKKIQYSCSSEPTLSKKNNFGNLFLISCLDCIDRANDNISELLEDLKNSIFQDIVNSKIFDSDEIKLFPNEDNLMDKKILYFKPNELEMINLAFNEKNNIHQRYEDFLSKKIQISFDFFYIQINSLVDILNSTNYLIDQNNIAQAEMIESFSGRFISENEKILQQWNNQLSEHSLDKFIEYYSEYVASYMEKILMRKNYSSYGVILLQKDINKIANYFQGDKLISIREKFNRLFDIISVLNFETNEELIEHLKKYDDIKLKSSEIEALRNLKK
jgi:hypothetical protein